MAIHLKVLEDIGSYLLNTNLVISLIFTETLFPEMQVNNNSSPTGFKITWNKPRDEVLSQLIYYHVTYQAVSSVNEPVNSSHISLNVSADSLEVSVGDLETYTTYKVMVEAITMDGESKKKKVIFTSKIKQRSFLSIFVN